MEIKLKHKYARVELIVQDGNTTTTSDYWDGEDINNLISELEEIIEELKRRQDK